MNSLIQGQVSLLLKTDQNDCPREYFEKANNRPMLLKKSVGWSERLNYPKNRAPA
jgi:hypothetical protein